VAIRKNKYLIIDTETSMKGNVIDFGAVIVDKKGKIYNKAACLVKEYWQHDTLFYDNKSGIFGKQNLNKRIEAYKNMIVNGDRLVCSINAINVWLIKCAKAYKPILTAYNLPFDTAHCIQSGIDLSLFPKEFCLWKEAAALFGKRKGYINHCIREKAFTGKLNMQTNAEIMSHYLSGQKIDEPHTALEDILLCELPIFTYIMRQKKKLLNISYNWRNYQMRDLVTAK